MEYILITGDSQRARYGAEAGVDRVMVDLEAVGKAERQGHLDTLISNHTMADVASVRAAVPGLTLMVRLDPWPFGHEQVEAAIGSGADVLMLPMFTRASEVTEFVSAVRGRAGVALLLETVRAAEDISDIVRVPGIDELHVGLNDLHIAMGSRFMFEPLANGLVEKIANTTLSAGINFGFGGIGRLSGPNLLDPALILSEHARLGSSQVLLSRDFNHGFFGPSPLEDLSRDLSALREHFEFVSSLTDRALHANSRRLRAEVARISDSRPL